LSRIFSKRRFFEGKQKAGKIGVPGWDKKIFTRKVVFSKPSPLHFAGRQHLTILQDN